MDRLFGILIVSLSLMTAAITLQISMAVGGGSMMAFVIIFIVFAIGLSLQFSNNRKKDKEDKQISNEEIEAELLDVGKQDRDK